MSFSFSKKFERCLAKYLCKLAEDSGFLLDFQFGFQKGLGTCEALLTIARNLQNALNSSHVIHVVGLDFSAAFGRVQHEILISKLQFLGINGSLSSTLSEFISGKIQKIVVDEQFRELGNVASVVPQALFFSLNTIMICGVIMKMIVLLMLMTPP